MKMKILLILFLFPLYAHAQTEVQIISDSLPLNVRTILMDKYNTYTVNTIYKNINKSGEVSYKIELQKKNKLLELTFNESGKLLSKEKSKIYTFKDKGKPKQTPSNSGDGHNHQH